MLQVARCPNPVDLAALSIPARGELAEIAAADEPSATPNVLTVHFDEQRIGVVPFVVEQHSTWAGPVRILRLALDSDGRALDVLGPHPATALTSALRHAAGQRRDWDVLLLDAATRPVRTRTSLRLAKLPFRQLTFRFRYGDPVTRFLVWSRPAWRSWPYRADASLRRRLREFPPGPEDDGGTAVPIDRPGAIRLAMLPS